MIDPILKGIALGLLLTVLIGPVFFVLIETSLRKGIRQALFVDLGIFVSDLLFILLAYLFTSEIEDMQSEKKILQIIGGSVFVIFGLATVFKKMKIPPENKIQIEIKGGNSLTVDIIKGFLLNALNPSVIFFWLTMVSVAQEEFGDNKNDIFIFFTSLLATFFGFDVLKIVLASYFKRFFTPVVLLWLNKIVGFGLLVFGVVLVIRGF